MGIVLVAGGLTAQSQGTNGIGTNVSIITGPASRVIEFLSAGTNYMFAPYGIITTDGKVGGGIALAYKLSDFVVPTLRFDYLDKAVWMPSASVQLQAPLVIGGKFTVIPFAFAGIATTVAGRGADNGDPVGIFGVGAAVRVAQHWDLVADYEKWSGFSGDQIRFGVLYKF